MLRIRTAGIGAVIATGSVTVTREMTTSFAAAIGATEGLDNDSDGDLVAPAGFIHVVEWPVMRGAAHLAALGVPAADLFHHLLHAFHDTCFIRPIRPGDLLHVSATFAAARQTQGGVLTTTLLDTADACGNAISRSWFGAFFRGAELDGPDQEAFRPPRLHCPSLDTSQTHTIFDNRREAAFLYSACSGLWNPIHTERNFATSLGLRDIAMHGSYAWSRCCDYLARQNRTARLTRFGARFSTVLHPGDVTYLRHSADLTGFELVNQAGELVLSLGTASFEKQGQGSALDPQGAGAP